MRFTWDPEKATSNKRKHGITFEEAATVFDDPLALIQPDKAHIDRLVILGESLRARMLFVVYIELEGAETFRIISARKATKHERKAYENQ